MDKDKNTKPISTTQFEQGDYYVENGYRVFTSKYLLKRGYCCSNNCRHCPYRSKKIK